MLKTISLIKRRPDVARDAFREHYENTHVPTALRRIRSFRKYLRNHIRGELNGTPPGFDCITEFWFPDEAAFDAVGELLAGPEGEAIRQDELTFMDKPRNIFFVAEERVLQGPPRTQDVGPSIKLAALLRRPPGSDARSFVESYERGPLAKLLEELGEPLRCTQNVPIRAGKGEPPCDCVTMLWYPGSRGVPAQLAGWAPPAERVVLLHVTEHETPAERLRP